MAGETTEVRGQRLVLCWAWFTKRSSGSRAPKSASSSVSFRQQLQAATSKDAKQKSRKASQCGRLLTSLRMRRSSPSG